MNMRCFLAWNKDTNELRKSTSGGIFYLIGKKVIEGDGYVCGCVWNSDFESARHIITKQLVQLDQMRGNKYVRSYLSSNVMKSISSLLLTNKKVLFSGCPCQIYALKFYLDRMHIPTDHLFTCSIICRGTPKPEHLRNYIRQIKKEYSNDDILSVNFREKQDTGNQLTKIVMKPYTRVINFPFVNEYVKSYFAGRGMTECCYSCRFKGNDNLQGDMIVGDFWGAQYEYPDAINKFGNSAVLLRTPKGEELFGDINDSISYIETCYDTICKYNTSLTTILTKPGSGE